MNAPSSSPWSAPKVSRLWSARGDERCSPPRSDDYKDWSLMQLKREITQRQLKTNPRRRNKEAFVKVLLSNDAEQTQNQQNQTPQQTMDESVMFVPTSSAELQNMYGNTGEQQPQQQELYAGQQQQDLYTMEQQQQQQIFTSDMNMATIQTSEPAPAPATQVQTQSLAHAQAQVQVQHAQAQAQAQAQAHAEVQAQAQAHAEAQAHAQAHAEAQAQAQAHAEAQAQAQAQAEAQAQAQAEAQAQAQAQAEAQAQAQAQAHAAQAQARAQAQVQTQSNVQSLAHNQMLTPLSVAHIAAPATVVAESEVDTPNNFHAAKRPRVEATRPAKVWGENGSEHITAEASPTTTGTQQHGVNGSTEYFRRKLSIQAARLEIESRRLDIEMKREQRSSELHAVQLALAQEQLKQAKMTTQKMKTDWIVEHMIQKKRLNDAGGSQDDSATLGMYLS